MRSTIKKEIGGGEFQISSTKIVKSIQTLDCSVEETSFGKGINKKTSEEIVREREGEGQLHARGEELKIFNQFRIEIQISSR
jgi:hypothetical protein